MRICTPAPSTFLKLLAICLLSFAAPWATHAQVDITTWQANLLHTGNNASETILTPGNISSPGNFGLLFSQPTDGQTYGQPLLVSGVTINATPHNVVYVATEHCSLYAFDADNNAGGNSTFLWRNTLTPTGTVPVPQSVSGSGDISVEVGITTTPVIDKSSNTIYIVSKVQRTSDVTYHQYLYALDLATGAPKFGSPVEINPTFPGTSTPDSVGGVIPFNPLREHMRAAMILYNGILYLTYASHSDTTPYHGEVIGYNPTTLQVVKTFTTTPNGGNPEGGIWQSGAGPAVDGAGNMFIAVGNGAWDQNNPSYGTNWGESMLKLPTTGAFTVSFSNTLNWFTPNNWQTLNGGDLDLGSGGLLLLPDQAGPHPHIMVGGGKGAVLYVVDRDNMGGMATPNNTVQEIQEPGGKWLFVTPAYYNGNIYYSAAGGPLEQRAVGYNPVDGTYLSPNPIMSTDLFNNKGDGCFITSNGTTNGIVWALTGGGIRAYNATNVSGSPIYSANATLPGNIGCQSTKFSLPMAANGKVYYAAHDSTNTGHLLVYGLLPAPVGTPIAPSNAVATAASSTTQTVTWTDNSTNESGFKVKRSTSATGPFNQVGSTTGADVTTFTDTGLNAFTTYYYQVVATNANGDSNASNVASSTTFPTYSENGLVAFWSMDESGGSTVSDVAGKAHTGTINGEAGLAVGFLNNGVNLHGTGQATSNITVANKADMQFAANQSFTLSAWVNPSALRSSDETIIAKSRDQGNYYGIWINASNQWVFRGPAGDVAGPAVTAGAWTHLAVVQDGAAGTRKIYVNGTLSGNGAAQAADGAGALWMGQQNILNNYASFPGTLDEVRLYNRALAAGEITSLMGPPVLEAVSTQTHGAAGTFEALVWPFVSKKIEPRKGSTTGRYSLVLNFSAPVSSVTATLGLQNGGTPVGSVSSATIDSTGKVVTVILTGVGNVQALNLRLSGILPGNGTADIPFNVLWADVNSDNVVNSLDLSIVQNSFTALVNRSSAVYDINCDGAVNATDASLVSSAIGTNLGPQSDTNLALFQPPTALSSIGGNTPAMAFDTAALTRWESAQKIDPEWIYVDLGSVCTIHTVVLDWENAAGKDYTIDISNDTTSWTPIQTVVGNTTAGIHTYPGLNAAARYVRMNGTARTNTLYGYSLYDFQVIGLSGTGGNAAPVITGSLSASGTVGTAFNYQISATNSPTSYNATGLPAGLTVNTTTGVISGMPTTAGTSSVAISATNASGTGSATLTVTINAAPVAPVITSPTTAAGTAGSTFNYQITASNSPTSYNATGLPAGLSVNTTTGVISGTPTAAGTSSATISATNSGGTGSATLTITISAATQAPVITSATTAGGTVGSAFNYQITASNTPTSYNATGLPAGLTVNTTTGAITGTSTAAGTSSATISATNSGGTGSATLTITISASGAAPSVTSATTATGTVGVAFNYQIVATNSPTNYGATGLPSGLAINTVNGLIQGSPNSPGTTSATISATNASGTGFATLTITVGAGTDTNLALNQPVTVSSIENGGTPGSAAVDGNSGTRWSSAWADPQYLYVDLGLVATVHSVVINWEDAAGKDYTIDVSNDQLTWTTIQPVTGNLTSGVHTYAGLNGTGQYVRMNGTARTGGYGYSMWEFQVFGVVGAGTTPAITSATTATGTVGSAFSYQITATNSPTSYNATGLPAGLSVNSSTGAITGTPTTAATSSATISATNASGTGSATLTITISAAPAPVITSASSASGSVGNPFTYQITASNSPTSYNATALPAGLSVNTATGAITGTPTAAGTSSATITATNSGGTGSATLTITIAAADTNVALGKVATASTFQAGNAPGNGNDGSLTTRWAASSGTYPQTWTVNLGATKTLSKMDINWYSSATRFYRYKIEFSADDITYDRTIDRTGNAVFGNTSDSFNVTAQYVRVTVTGCSAGGAYASAFEFKVFGH